MDDVEDILKEIFNANPEVNFILESRVQTAPLSNRNIFVICLTFQSTSTIQTFSWPQMQEDQAVVFESLKKI